jgi:hypothetical protein
MDWLRGMVRAGSTLTVMIQRRAPARNLMQRSSIGSCVELGFTFEYKGYKISAEILNNNGAKPVEARLEQLQINFDGQLNLTDQTGTVSINVKRPPAVLRLRFRKERGHENRAPGNKPASHHAPTNARTSRVPGEPTASSVGLQVQGQLQ